MRRLYKNLISEYTFKLEGTGDILTTMTRNSIIIHKIVYFIIFLLCT